jgi:hypothetical protein
MRTIGWTAVLAGLALGPAAGRADEAGGARAVVDKAIQAAGGADVLKKYPAMTAKAKGTFYGLGDGIEFTAELFMQYPDKRRREIDAGGMKIVDVVNGGKGWASAGEMVQEMPKEMLDELREEMYCSAVTGLRALLGDGFKLTALEPIKVGDKPALGVRVSKKGHRDVSLYFDKDTGLLLRSEWRGKDPRMGTGFTEERLIGGYKKIDGLQVPFKVTVKHDGKLFIEQELTEAKPAEKLDDKLFAKP